MRHRKASTIQKNTHKCGYIKSGKFDLTKEAMNKVKRQR